VSALAVLCLAGDIGGFFVHLGNMPGVPRANAYAADRSVVWSSDRRVTLSGRPQSAAKQ
jgi:hypothetical protein